MQQHNAPTIGDNLARIRRRREQTQENLAERSGVSVETIRKLEQNERTSARISTLNRLARALGVPTSQLFGTSGKPAARREQPTEVPLLALRQALFPARTIGGATLDTEAEPSPLPQIQAMIRHVDSAYHADDYATAVTALPQLLTEATAAARDADSRSADAHVVLSQAHQLAGTVLIQLRRFDLAHRALDLSLDAADRGSDRVVAASTVVTLCWLLLRQGRLDEAERLAITTADEIEPSFTRAVPEALATWGWLMIRAAAATSRNNRDDVARDALDAAAAAAMRIDGDGVPRFTPGPATVGAFCSTTVAMKRVETAVIVGDSARALDLATGVPPSDRPTSNNRNRHLLDVAWAQVDQRRYAEATGTLLRVRADAPSWLRHQRFARDIVACIASARRRAMSDELADLADVVGLEL